MEYTTVGGGTSWRHVKIHRLSGSVTGNRSSSCDRLESRASLVYVFRDREQEQQRMPSRSSETEYVRLSPCAFPNSRYYFSMRFHGQTPG